MFGLHTQELLIILLIVVILFGASKIPQMLKGLGTGIKEFKKGMKEDDEPKKEEKAESIQESGKGGGGNGHPTP
jgi:sec-independent protein translocase protein TatA